ncbi:hypothetical protein EDI28_21545 [Photobacterium chitinilyticum]|uniref:Uncharacterized protein n=1 Tax=Photobacterium chitinilyticum TaxID=2485123 RepID=A0A3S3UGH4_9GAMM|nr:hypothetical protein EDI28_21545 [Photobacterium chitinilyticum]
MQQVIAQLGGFNLAIAYRQNKKAGIDLRNKLFRKSLNKPRFQLCPAVPIGLVNAKTGIKL